MTCMSLKHSPLRNALSEHELLGTTILETAMNTHSCRETTKICIQLERRCVLIGSLEQ